MPDLPIACTLEAATLAEHGDALLPGLARRATGLCWQPDGVRLIFGFDEPFLASISAVITAERCASLRGALGERDEAIG